MKSLRSIWVYLSLGFAITLIFAKYIFVASSIEPSFIVNDLIALLLIVVALFVHLQSILFTNNTIESHTLEVKLLKEDFEAKRKKLLETIDSSESKSNEEKKGIVIVGSVKAEINKLSSVKDVQKKANKVLSILATHFDITTGILYKKSVSSSMYNVLGTYSISASDVASVEPGVGLHGQALLTKESRVIDSIPEDYYTVYSGLGESKSSFLYLLPISNGDETIGLIELSSFKRVKIDKLWDELNNIIGNILAKD